MGSWSIWWNIFGGWCNSISDKVNMSLVILIVSCLTVVLDIVTIYVIVALKKSKKSGNEAVSEIVADMRNKGFTVVRIDSEGMMYWKGLSGST